MNSAWTYALSLRNQRLDERTKGWSPIEPRHRREFFEQSYSPLRVKRPSRVTNAFSLRVKNATTRQAKLTAQMDSLL